MSYLVLARKYRPQRFADVIGQGHVTGTLANAIAADRVAHAYLFCGPRGVGKTTAARLLAKRLNCETRAAERAQGATALDPEPCNTCASCRDITAGRSLDVLEIDGASNRGIDEIRQLRENTRYLADEGRVKLYIIDEVHMLTREAFNALLKTLEEPPPRVIFVLATTDPFKVPATILSRCQRFDFVRLSSRDIAEHLAAVLGAEGMDAEPEALALLARRAEGGVRDALSLLDQVIAAGEGKVDRAGVEGILGLVGDEALFGIADALAEANPAEAIRRVNDLYRRGADLEDVARGLVDHLRGIYLLAVGSDLEDLLEVPASELPRYRSQAARFTAEALGDLVDRAVVLQDRLRRSETPRIAVELAMAEMAMAAQRTPIGEVITRLEAMERRIAGTGAPPPEPAAPPRSAAPPARPERTASVGDETVEDGMERPSGVAAPRIVAGSSDPQQLWAEALALLMKKSRRLGTELCNVRATGFGPGGELLLGAAEMGALTRENLGHPEDRGLVEEALREVGAAVPRFALADAAPSGSAGARPAAAGPSRSTTPTRAAGHEKREPAAKAPPAGKGTPKTAAAKPVNRVAPAARAEGGKREAEPPSGAEAKAEDGGTGPDKAPAPAEDSRSMGEVFRDEPMIQKVIDMFDGEVLP